MHPIISDKKKLLLYLTVWGLLGILSGWLLSVFAAITIVHAITFTLPMFLIYGEVNLSAWYICRAFPLERTSAWKVFAVSVTSVFIVSFAWTLLGWGWKNMLENFFSVSYSPLPLFQSLLIVDIVGKQLFFISIVIGYLLSAFQRSRDAERNVFEAKLLAQNAELKALRMQIDPHFLFNSLNSISALTMSNAELARTMTTTLADFFRKSLAYGGKEFISLQEELSLLNHYLDIEKIRFGKRLVVRQQIAPDALTDLIPPLLLQPLAENAIKHGIADSVDGGKITISAEKKNGRLFVAIENPADHEAQKKKGTGLGLEIVRKRLQALYGNESDLRTTVEPESFRVILFFPTTRRT